MNDGARIVSESPGTCATWVEAGAFIAKRHPELLYTPSSALSPESKGGGQLLPQLSLPSRQRPVNQALVAVVAAATGMFSGCPMQPFSPRSRPRTKYTIQMAWHKRHCCG